MCLPAGQPRRNVLSASILCAISKIWLPWPHMFHTACARGRQAFLTLQAALPSGLVRQVRERLAHEDL